MRRGKLAALVPLIGAAVAGLAGLGSPAQAARSDVARPAAPAAAAGLTAMSHAAGPARSAAAAGNFTPLNGFGSSWAGPAIEQWSRDVVPEGITINFDPTGSAAGRQAYMLDQADFAASDIAFLTTPDPFQGGTENPPYAYSYIPITAGGTSFLYNLQVGGRKITNLRLSGETIMKVFTGQITNWDNPAITADYGAQLPSIPITVVVRADGSGASYQFSRWMWKEFPSDWQAFCTKSGGPSGNCGPTEFYPVSALPDGKSLNGSDLVANYIGSPENNGAIGYDEYAYALDNNIPVVAMENAAGYDVLPTASNVAIALQKAVINEDPSSLDFLIQDLDGVYTYNDPRTYPLSSYSYLIVPRDSRVVSGATLKPPPIFNTSKGDTLTTWLNFVLCGAQQSAGALGYSPLPYPLITGGYLQFSQIPGAIHVGNVSSFIASCKNPTYYDGQNLLIKDAPYPSPCQFHTAPLNCVVKNGHPVAASAPGSGAAGSAAAAAGAAGKGAGQINPNTGQLTGATGTGSGSGINASPVSVSGPAPQQAWLFGVLIVFALLGAIVAPTVLGSWLERRRAATATPGTGTSVPQSAGAAPRPREPR